MPTPVQCTEEESGAWATLLGQELGKDESGVGTKGVLDRAFGLFFWWLWWWCLRGVIGAQVFGRINRFEAKIQRG